MKYFLISLLSVITFYAFSQTVTIPNDVARWYLVQAEKVVLLEKQDSINVSIIKKQGEMLLNKGTIITLLNQNVSFKDTIIQQKDSIILNRDERIEGLEKKVKNRTLQRDLSIGVGVGAGVGSFLGQPVIGAAVGGGVVLIRRVFKKK